MKLLPRAIVFVALALFAAPVLAADVGPGFWSGYLDGFLSLLKLVLSPLMDVTIVSENFGPWAYSIGYYLGVLSFAGAAGAVAASGEPSADVQWG
jgi:hypothetical protein